MLGVILDKGSLGFDVDYANLTNQLSEWQYYPTTAKEDVSKRIAGASVVVTNKVYLGREELAHASNLKLICISATGTNNVDLAAASSLGISVCNVTAYATPSVVEHTFSLILSLVRNLNAYRQDVASGQWFKSKHFCLLDHPISELAGKKLGIIGYGELGQAVAKVGEAFGMEVLIAQSLRTDQSIVENRIALDELLTQVDILSLHCPLTEQTKGLINQQRIAQMKKTAIIINTARGGIVDEEALHQALCAGDIAAAGIDVLENEPPLEGNKLLSLSLPNLIVTPHIAWASRESRQRLINEVANNIHAFFSNQPRNLVRAC